MSYPNFVVTQPSQNPPAPGPDVLSAMDHLSQSLQKLGEASNLLLERLTPVLSDRCEKNFAFQTSASRCALANLIREKADHIENNVLLIQSILNSLEI